MADYQKMYATVCAAASEAVDELENIPLAVNATLILDHSDTEKVYH